MKNLDQITGAGMITPADIDTAMKMFASVQITNKINHNFFAKLEEFAIPQSFWESPIFIEFNRPLIYEDIVSILLSYIRKIFLNSRNLFSTAVMKAQPRFRSWHECERFSSLARR